VSIVQDTGKVLNMNDEPLTSWEMGNIKDARDREVSQLDPVIMHMARKHDVIPRESLEVIARKIGFGMTKANQITLWATVLCVVSLGIALTILLVRYFNGAINLGKLIRSLLPFGCLWLAPLGFWMGTSSVRFQRITKIMLEHQHCPHCGYDLRGLPVDSDDGATICPECGCAWMLSRVDQIESADDA